MWTLDKIKGLVAAGKIRGYLAQENKEREVKSAGRIVSQHFRKRSKEKDWIAWNLWVWCAEHKYQLLEEYKFSEERGFRADWAIDVESPYGQKILLEYEGLFSEKSGHTTPTGYTKDSEKYMLAQSLGFRVLRFTALNYKTLLTELNKLI